MPNVRVFTTDAEKRTGLSVFRNGVPVGVIFLFPYVGFPQRIHTHTMSESIMVYELDRNLQVVQETQMRPLRMLVLDPRTMHVVETSRFTPRPSSFKFLKVYVE